MALPPRSASALLRASVAAALLAGSGLAAAQNALVVLAGTTVSNDPSAPYYTTGNISGTWNVDQGAGAAFFDTLTVNTGGAVNAKAGLELGGFATTQNQGTITNAGTATFLDQTFSATPTTVLNNTGTFVNHAGATVSASVMSLSPQQPAATQILNSGTFDNAGRFSNWDSGYNNSPSPLYNSGMFYMRPAAGALTNVFGAAGNGGSAVTQPAGFFTNSGPTGSPAGTLVVQITDGQGEMRGRFENPVGGLVQLDPAAGTTQTFAAASTPGVAPTGAITGAGEVRKTSPGTTVYAMPMAYTGPTNINAGSLLVNGAGNLATSTSTVASGALLGGDGTAGPSTVQSGGLLSPGFAPVGMQDSVGTLKIAGKADLQAGSITQFELGTPTAPAPAAGVADPAGDLVKVTGDLAMNGVLQLQPGTSLAAGAYKVFTYTGALTNGASLDTSLAQTNGLTLSIDTSVPSEVWLVAKQMLPQVITYTSTAPTNATVGGATYPASTTSDSGLPVTLTSTTPAACTIDANGVVSFVGAGTCTLQADQAGDSTYLPAAAVQQSFNVVAGGTQPPITPAAATPVPTLGHGALALLSLLTAGLAFWRRRSA